MLAETITEIQNKLPPNKVGTFLDSGLDRPISLISEVNQICRPKVIFEIGTHCGHSSLLILANTESYVISTDIDDEWVDANSLKTVNDVLSSYFPDRFNGIIRSSFDHDFFVKELDVLNIDLIHIDGLHTYEACRKDIQLGKKLCSKWFLVDDFNHDDLKRACFDENLVLIKEWENVHSVCANVGLLKSKDD